MKAVPSLNTGMRVVVSPLKIELRELVKLEMLGGVTKVKLFGEQAWINAAQMIKLKKRIRGFLQFQPRHRPGSA
jgi:hypothetical protein